MHIDDLPLSGENLRGRLVAAASDLFDRTQSPQAVQGSLNQIVGIMRPQTLGQYVLNTSRFKDRSHRTAGNDSSTGGGGFQHDQTGAEFPLDLMGDARFGKRYALHILACLLQPLANGLGNLIGLAQSVPDFSIAVTDNANRTKTEATSTLYNFGGTINEDNFFNKLVFRAFILKI